MSVWPDADRGRSRRRARRADNPVRVVAVAGGFGAAVLLAGSVVAGRVADRVVPSASAGEIEAASVEVLSARRLPVTLSHLSRVGRVVRSLAVAAGKVPGGSCATVDWEGERLLEIAPALPLVPASAMKVVTAAVALEVLGPEHTYVTTLNGSVDATGTASGLWLVGGGDPVLHTAAYPATEKYGTFNGTSLEKLADAAVAAGLRRVAGNVIGVDTRYDAERFVAAWPSSFHGLEAGPLGALMVDDGTVFGRPQKPDDPAVAAAEMLRQLLVARGVVVDGVATHDVLPADRGEIARVTSLPLTAILQEMLVNSDNNTSELVLKEIGLKKTGVGSTASGVEVVTETMSGWGLAADLVVVDGSGLASGNRVPCATFATLLERSGEVLPGLLPVAGETGTLREIFDGEDVAGRLVGKTGTLSGVKALVGYVPVDEGDTVRFTLVLNSPGADDRSRYRPVWYSFGDALALARSTPRADQLAP